MIFPTFCRLELRECHGAWSLFSTNKKCCCCCLVPKLCLGCPSTVAHQAPLSLARILELVVISFSRRSFRPWDWEPTSPALAGRFFTAEPPGKPFLHDPFDIRNWDSSLRGVELLRCAALPEVSRVMHIPLRAPAAQGKVGRKQSWWYDSLWIFGVWSFSKKHALNFFFFFYFLWL